MCLDTVNERIGTPTTLIQSGWKTFAKGTFGKLKFENCNFRGKRDVPMDEWITAEPVPPTTNEYGAGFHVYENEDDKRTNDWRRVYYRQVVARGRQTGRDVAVALEIFVPSEENAWPPS